MYKKEVLPTKEHKLKQHHGIVHSVKSTLDMTAAELQVNSTVWKMFWGCIGLIPIIFGRSMMGLQVQAGGSGKAG
nr:uncharacterized protein LOC125991598 isoform X3 [Syngnathus scovelli]